MQFRIADTFTASLQKLDGQSQKATKTTAFDLQINQSHPGLKFHRIERAKDENFWSVRVSRDVRLIVHKTASSLLLCYVDHHDKAYAWAERRKIETHPRTGAAQIVEVRETVEEVTIPTYVEANESLAAHVPLFAAVADEALLDYGIPADWLSGVREVRDEDDLFDLADHLPGEAAEALLELAVGGTPAPRAKVNLDDPFDHPDAQRRFRAIEGRDELQTALDYPWDKWTIFLHPTQRGLVSRNFNGPARVAGSAGTGKTIVALHRAVHLARENESARLLLTTFSETLANALRQKLTRLIAHQPELAERVDVRAIDQLALELQTRHGHQSSLADTKTVNRILQQSASELGIEEFSSAFLASEWRDVVDAWQLDTWDSYRSIHRLGRKTRLPEARREKLWQIFERTRKKLVSDQLATMPMIYHQLCNTLQQRNHPVYDYVVVDEAQDLSVPQLQFLAAAVDENNSNALFFSGDLGQRIFQTPFSWKKLGVDIRGRSNTLHINYRTSHQIRHSADQLLDPSITDVDGNAEHRSATVSLFEGPPPTVQICENESEEIDLVARWLTQQKKTTGEAHELAVIVRSSKELPRARRAIESAGLESQELNASTKTKPDAVALATMHFAKGLEFRAVVVMACDEDAIPSQTRLAAVAEAADLAEIYNTERHLLYVACTRARDHLLITAVDPASEFLDDLG
ncbi:3'-5' exonuclease [Salinisphaera aquimarina]|uniref:DNA 3'-5' helicase n=1 Tax=Salinisphaera aquimarina TaxID=2094031 RepID=A0ABV7ESX5_9GAMM